MDSGLGASSPVDVVYLWVDGSDPKWRIERKRAYQQWEGDHPGQLARYGDTDGRYRDNGELRYNLRALDRFFPDVNHVWIVTGGQSPIWLNPNAPATVIDYRTLPKAPGSLVFDSGHIESLIHHLPGLSEQFFYLNDDVFFGAPVDPEWWFGPRAKVFQASDRTVAVDELQPGATALFNAYVLSRDWLSVRFGDYQHDKSMLAHAPRPMLRSALLRYESVAPELFAAVREPVFRKWQTPPIVSELLPRWMVHERLAEFATAEHLYIESCNEVAPRLLAELAQRFASLPFFCINDTCDDAPPDDPRLVRVRDTLGTLLPAPSRFERPTAIP
jgi:hypothetical protein